MIRNAGWVARTTMGALTLMIIAACGGSGGVVEQAGQLIRANQGGQVSNGGCSVNIPAGALSQDTRIVVTPTSNVPSAPPNHAVVQGTTFQMGPSGTQFSTPATVTIHYNPSSLPQGADEANLRIYTVVAGQWQQVQVSTPDPENNRVTAQVNHFSMFGILAHTTSGGTQIRMLKNGDQWVNRWTFDVNGHVHQETGTTTIGTRPYNQQQYSAFVFGENEYTVFTQDPTTRTIQFVATVYGQESRPLNDSVPGTIGIGTIFQSTEGGAQGDTVVWRMTVVSQENVTVPAGTFLAYKATGQVISEDIPGTPIAKTLWISPHIGVIKNEFSNTLETGGTSTARSELQSYTLVP